MNWIILIIVILAILIAICIAYYLAQMTTKEISGSAKEPKPGLNLLDEYARWQTAQGQLQLIMRASVSRQSAYEIRAIFERWQISLANARLKGSEGSGSAEEATRKMRSELIEKSIYRDPAEVDALLRELKQERAQCRADVRGKLIISGGLIKYGAYTGCFSANRIALLRKYATDEHIAATALRYAALMPGGQQWSVPARVYDVLIEKFGVSLEGFASPFNSQLLRHRETLKKQGRDAQFCSLFLDTDAIFGSIGNFFDCDLAGKIAVINPPYIVSLMEAATKKILATFEEASVAAKPTRMFIIVPNWTDADYFAALSGSRFLERQMTHGKGASFFEEGDRAIFATFGTTVFILSTNMPPLAITQDDDIARLEEAFKPTKK